MKDIGNPNRKPWSKLRKTLVALFVAAVVYSFLPLIPFYFMRGADPADNNSANAEKLSHNRGTYFSFIVSSDIHAGLAFTDAASLKEIWHINREDRFRKIPTDFVLTTGDITLDGTRRQFLAYKKIQELIKFPVISAIGNHDNPRFFDEFCGENEFAFANRNSYFIVLNNEEGQIREEQFRWLEDNLKKGQAFENIFIAMHKPPFNPYQQDWYNVEAKPWAYRFRKLCGKYGVKMVFSGHRHMFKHEQFDGVDYIVTGGGGMLTEIPDADGGYLHYVVVTVENDYVTYEVRKVSPPLWEYITYYFWKEAVYWVRNFYGTGYIFGRNTRIEPVRGAQEEIKVRTEALGVS